MSEPRAASNLLASKGDEGCFRDELVHAGAHLGHIKQVMVDEWMPCAAAL
jgi:hypothetical protein